MNRHSMPRTTSQLRAETHESELSNVELAEKFNVHSHAVVLIESARRVGKEAAVEHRYNLSSCPVDTKAHADLIREH